MLVLIIQLWAHLLICSLFACLSSARIANAIIGFGGICCKAKLAASLRQGFLSKFHEFVESEILALRYEAQ